MFELSVCIICGKYSVTLCPNCYKPLCTHHGSQAEQQRIKGEEVCRGEKKDSRPVGGS